MRYYSYLLHLCFLFSINSTALFSQECNIVGEGRVCKFDETEYEASHSLTGNGITYQWYLSGGGGFQSLPPNTESVTILWDLVGTWNVICEIYQLGVLKEACMMEVTVSSVEDLGAIVLGMPLYQSNGVQTYCLGSEIEILVNLKSEAEVNEQEISYTWIIEGVEVLTLEEDLSLHVEFLEEGIVEICVIISDVAGCQKKVCFEFNVVSIDELSFKPYPDVLGLNPISVCKGQEVFFVNTSEMVDILKFEWEISDGTNTWIMRSTDLTFTFTEALNYSVKLKPQIGSNVCDYEPFIMEVHVADESVVPILCPMIVCNGDEICYTAGVDCASYLWDISDEGSITSTMDDEVCVIWDNLPGNSMGALIFNSIDCNGLVCNEPTIEYIPLFPPHAKISGDEVICGFNSVKFYSLPTDWEGVLFNWSIDMIDSPNGTVSIPSSYINANPTRVIFSNSFSGSFRLNVTATQNMGACVFSDSKEVTLFNQRINGGNFCYGTDATVSLIPPASNPVDWIIVDRNGTIVYEEANGESMIHIPATAIVVPGVYTAMAMIPGGNPGNCMLEGDFTVLQPISNPYINGPISVCLNEISVYSVSNAAGYNVEWEIVDGNQTINPMTTQNMIMHTWTHPTGPYIIRARYKRTVPPLCSSEFTELNVHMADPDDILIGGNITPCPDNIIPLEYFASFQGGNDFQWSLDPSSLGSIVDGQGTGTVSVLWHYVDMPTDVTISVSTLGCNNNLLTNDLVVTITPADISITGPPQVCAYEDVTLSTTAVGEYSWYYDGEIIGHDQELNFSFAESGLQSVTLIVMNPNNCNGQFAAVHEIEVIANPIPPIFLSDFVGCHEPQDFPDDIFLLTYEYGDPNVTYLWKDPSNDPFGGDEPFVEISEIGLYTLEVTQNGCSNINSFLVDFDCEGSCSCTPQFDKFKIKGYILDDITCGKVIVQGEVDPLDDDRILSLKWRFQNPVSGAAPLEVDIEEIPDLEQTITYRRAGIYLAELIANWQCPDLSTCPKVDKLFIRIPVVSEFNWTYSCVGDGSFYNVTLTDQSTAINPLLPNVWSGDIVTSSGQNITFTGEAGETYEIQLTQETVDHKTCTTTHFITIPDKPEPEFQTDLEGFCEMQDVEITPSNIDLNEVYQVVWDFGDGSTSHLLSPHKVYSSPDGSPYPITMELQTIYGCIVEFETEVIVNENMLDGEIQPVPLDCQTKSELSFDQFTGGTIVGWKWSNGMMTPTIIVNQSGLYSVTVIDDLGCSFSYMKNITVFPVFPLGIMGQTEVCQDVYLEVSNPQGADVQWSILQNNMLIDSEVGIVYSTNLLPPGQYHVIVEGLSGTTVCEKLEVDLKIHGSPEEPILTYELENCIPFQGSIESNVLASWTGEGISFPIVSMNLGISAPGVYTATLSNDFGCMTSKEIDVPEELNFSSLATGCGMVCKDDFEPGDLCLEGIPGDDFLAWAWKLDGTNIPDATGDGEIECLEILESYLNKVITLYVVDADGNCSAESDPFFIQGKNCHPCPEELQLTWMAGIDYIQCVDLGSSGERVLSIKFVLFLPEDYTYCDEEPIFEDGYFDYDVLSYSSTTHSLLIEGDYHITDIPGFNEDFVIRGSIDLCSDDDPALKCPASFEIASMNCHDQCAVDPCLNGVTCNSSLDVTEIHNGVTYLTYCVYLVDPAGECGYEGYVIYGYDQNGVVFSHTVNPARVRPNGLYCFEFEYETEFENICIDFEVYDDCHNQTFCEATICVANSDVNGSNIETRSSNSIDSKFLIVPNPVTGQDPVLHCGDIDLKSLSLNIYSASGHLMKNLERELIEGGTTISTSGMGAGYYLVQVLTNGREVAYLPLIILNN